MTNQTEDTFVHPGAPDASGLRGENLQVFSSGSLKFAILDTDIATVTDWRTPTPLPRAPAAVLGIVSIEGRMLTLLDPAVLLGQSADENRSGAFIVALRGDEQLALRVDAEGKRPVATVEIEQPPEMSGQSLLGVIKSDSGAISILDVEQLFGLAIRGRERRRRSF